MIGDKQMSVQQKQQIGNAAQAGSLAHHATQDPTEVAAQQKSSIVYLKVISQHTFALNNKLTQNCHGNAEKETGVGRKKIHKNFEDQSLGAHRAAVNGHAQQLAHTHTYTENMVESLP